MARILLVSNRLPVTFKTEQGRIVVSPSPGGLATGLRGRHERSGGLWLGWPGNVSDLGAVLRQELEQRLEELRIVPLYLTDEEHEAYYQGFSNGALWPLCHYLLDKVAMDAQQFAAYRSVNERFADLVASRFQAGDLIWVHDYHLMLLPGLLRERLPDARIGFFLHIPFPSYEVFRILPWRRGILEGLLGADLIGFHTLAYLRHFTTSLLRIAGLESQVDHLAYNGREVRLGAFPMGIDVGAFTAMAESEDARAAAAAIRGEAGDRKILLGIDRLDYTKGLPTRLLAFERLLERKPELREKVRFLQVAEPSRVGIGPYDALGQQVDELAGRINGRFGTATAVPVHYMHQSFTQPEVVTMYRAADVMVVTPLRDGMNLVAKEFCASRTDEDGVLILSEFAGAAAELGEALRVNPYDVDQLAEVFEQALEMSAEERRTRMRSLRQRVMEYDVHRWANSFLEVLESMPGGPSKLPSSLAAAPVADAVIARIRAETLLSLFLDYDGTLTPLMPFPELASPDDDLRELMAALLRKPGIRVHMLSGRARDDLERWFGELPIGLYAEHGLWMRPPHRDWTLLTELAVGWKDQVRAIMEQFVAHTPGSFIEEKTASLAWHYRNTDVEFGSVQAKELRIHLAETLSNVPVEVLKGSKVIEVRMYGVHKGAAVRRVLAENGEGAIVAMGDDRTDEDMFAALPPGSYSIHVGPRQTGAEYFLPDARAARDFLRRLS
jgi:trehalose 6-phosphate synthase/phosphatase